MNLQEQHRPLFGPSGAWRDHFPSEPSARHYLRLHGPELLRVGALDRHLGRWRVRPTALAAAIDEISRREAAHALGVSSPEVGVG